MQKFYLAALIPLGIALLGNTPFILANERVSSIYNVLCRTIVTLKTENVGLRIILFEVENVLYAGPAEGIDTLSVITHHGNVLMILRKCPKYHILKVIGILILIYQNELELCLNLSKSLRKTCQKAVRIQKDIIKIHHPLLFATGLICCI